MIKCPSQPTPPAARGSAAARKPGRAGWAPHSSGSSPAAAGRLSQLTAATLGTDAYSYSEDKAPDGRKGDWTNEQHLPRRGEGAMGCARVNIGNRKTAQEAAEEATAYDVNNLNQYTAIQEGTAEAFVPTFDADGKAPDGCKGDWTNARHLPEGRGAEGRLRVNQTKVKTSTGIWNVVYNAENRPVTFTSEDGATVVECTYDYVGRRHTRKITVNGSVTNYLRYIYRGYLQIAAINAVSGVFQWFILWDPTQPVATRPLGIRKDGTWYTYGWDLTKNICEVFGSDGYIKTAYTYTPYGAVTANGNVTQPIQWSSEYNDTELGLVYYNYRHYNPADGRWTGRDWVLLRGCSLYGFLLNRINMVDYLGLADQDAIKCCKDGKQYPEVLDDAKRRCCEYEIQEVAILVIPRYTEGHFVGHAWVKTPNMQYGFYPEDGSKTSGALYPVQGKVKNDSRYEHLASPSNSYYYRACPESVDSLERLINEQRQLSEDGELEYFLYNGETLNCCGWACKMLNKAGFTAPFNEATFMLAPGEEGSRGYGEGREPKKWNKIQ